MKQYKLPKGYSKTNFHVSDGRTFQTLLYMLNDGNTIVKFVVLYPEGVSKIYQLSNVTNSTTTMKKKVNKLKTARTAVAKKAVKKAKKK